MDSQDNNQINPNNQVSQPQVQSLEVKAEEVHDNPLSENFAKLLKQEKHNAELRRQLEAERKKVEQDRLELEARRQSQSQQQQVFQDPNSAAAYYKAELEKRDREAAERKINEEYARREHKLDEQIKAVVKGEDFDIIDKLEAHKRVKDKMAKHLEKSGEVLTVKAACELVADEIANEHLKIKDSRFLKPKEVVKEVPSTQTSIVNKIGQIPAPKKALTEEDRLKAAEAYWKANHKR